MRKRVFFALAMATSLSWTAPALADTISFDVDGTGGGTGVIAADLFDWLPGNSLLQEISAFNPITGAPGVGRVLFQANLGTIQDTVAPTATFTNGQPFDGTTGEYFTAVGSFDVAIIAPSVFAILPGGEFRIYADAEAGIDLAGTGFAADAGAKLVMAGDAIGGGGALVPFGAGGDLDQYLGDNYPGVDTIRGVGGFDADVIAYYVNPLYFIDAANPLLLFFSNTDGSNNLPFDKVNPSALFSSNAIADGDVTGVASVGPVNGLCLAPLLGCNIMAQSDVSTTFDTTVVPEPATLTLLGLGLAATAAARRRKAKQAKS